MKKPTPQIPKRKRGRPTDFLPRFAHIAEELAKEGATNDKIAKVLGVNVGTVTTWRKKHQEFKAAIMAGKEVADDAVVQSLYERATGYSHGDVHIAVVKGEVVKTEIVRHYPPDTQSMIFWLKNRRPLEWREKSDVDVTSDGHALHGYSAADIAAMASVAALAAGAVLASDSAPAPLALPPGEI